MSMLLLTLFAPLWSMNVPMTTEEPASILIAALQTEAFQDYHSRMGAPELFLLANNYFADGSKIPYPEKPIQVWTREGLFMRAIRYPIEVPAINFTKRRAVIRIHYRDFQQTMVLVKRKGTWVLNK